MIEPKTRYTFPVWGAVRDAFRVLTLASAEKDKGGHFGALDRPRAEHFDAAMRHLVEYQQGVKADATDGLPPLSHAIARLLILDAMGPEAPSEYYLDMRAAEEGEKRERREAEAHAVLGTIGVLPRSFEDICAMTGLPRMDAMAAVHSLLRAGKIERYSSAGTPSYTRVEPLEKQTESKGEPMTYAEYCNRMAEDEVARFRHDQCKRAVLSVVGDIPLTLDSIQGRVGLPMGEVLRAVLSLWEVDKLKLCDRGGMAAYSR